MACEDAGDLENDPRDSFIRLYGLEGNQEGVDLVVSGDDEYYLLGNSTNRNNKQIYLVRADAAGKIVWQKTFGGPGEETAKDIELLPSGDLVIVGDTRSPAGDTDILVLIVNSSGVRVDSVVRQNPNFDEQANSVTPITTGFLIAGTTTQPDPDPAGVTDTENNVKDGIIIRLNSDLTLYTGNWDEQFGLGTIMSIEKVTQENPGLFTVFSYTNGRDINTTGLNNFYIFSVDNAGSPLGVREIGRPEDDEIVTSVARDKLTSGYAVTGISTKPNGRQEAVYTFIGVAGGALTGGTLADVTVDLAQTQNQIPISTSVVGFGTGFFLVGATKNFSPDQTSLQGDIFLKLIDRQGSDLWRNPPSITFGGVANDFIGAVAETGDQRILVVGTMGVGDVQGQRKVAFIKVNREGKFAP
jgi:hypothetical protein